MLKPRILVIDDDRNLARALAIMLEVEGYETRSAYDATNGASELAAWSPHLVLTDLQLPNHDGLWVLDQVRALSPETRTIVITAYGTVERAVEAMKRGALDFVTKPLNEDELKLKIAHALEFHRLLTENEALRAEVALKYDFPNIIGRAPKFLEALRIVTRVAGTDATVLVRGESGTGKELVARAIHQHSRRAQGPFIAVSCAALAPTLLESELFGHEKGAFTGAVSAKPGRFELAHGGTLFLDEIGDLDASLQVKLLRVLEERKFERVGGTKTIEVDVRMVAATNLNLEEQIQEKKFRPDLYYRLNVVSIKLPILAERPDDIPVLADHFVEKYRQVHNRPGVRLAPEVLAVLGRYPWPGNVRELENAIEYAIIASDRDTIGPEHLPPAVTAGTADPAASTLPGAVEQLEKARIQEALERAGWVQLEAARLLGLRRGALQYKMKKYGLTKPDRT